MNNIAMQLWYHIKMIVGIDEVGRGAWAGPMAVGAVILGGATIDGLTDSKKLSKKQRERLDLEIRQKALAIGIGWVSARDIDTIGLSPALKLAARRALAHIRCEYNEVIIDGTIALIDDPRVTLMKKADLLVPSVSAAAIVAKVARDRYMHHIDTVFPGYSFTGHVGYGTAAHRTAIASLGASPIHRVSYAPLRQYDAGIKATAGTTKCIGDAGEGEVVLHLQRAGHEILVRNWRTKYCEIDVVSRQNGKVYFTEVKYRKDDTRGGGLAAITAKKQRQMAFAAELYALKNGLRDTDLLLAAASVTGTPPRVVEYLELT
jgi:ribonuclease HII